MKYKNEPTELIVGDGNTFHECCTVHRGTIQDNGKTIVGDDNWIMAYVHIGHDSVIGNNTIMANNVTLGGHISPQRAQMGQPRGHTKKSHQMTNRRIAIAPEAFSIVTAASGTRISKSTCR